MTHLVLVLIFLLLGCGKTDTPQAAPPAQTSVTASQGTDSPAMFVASLTSYDIGIMRKGPKWSSEAPAKMKEISKKNGEPWRQAVKEGSLVGLAQIVDPKEIVAIFFFKNKTQESMKAMAKNAPIVKAGLVTAEVQKVWGTKGLGADIAEKMAADPKMTPTKETYYLVYTTKGKNWSAKSDAPETREVTSEQIQYMYELHKAGQMKYFCAFEDMNMTIRGFGLFKANSDKEALELMTKSPSVKKGWLTADVKTVEVTAGVLK
jgi:hypothetical protein